LDINKNYIEMHGQRDIKFSINVLIIWQDFNFPLT